MQDHAADQLDVEVALAEGALGRLAHGREGRDQDAVDAFACSQLGAEFVRAGTDLIVGEFDELGL